MSLPKSLLLFACILFGLIGLMAVWKGKPVREIAPITSVAYDVEQISISTNGKVAEPLRITLKAAADQPVQVAAAPAPVTPSQAHTPAQIHPPADLDRPVPEADEMYRFFTLDAKQFPIVETITYKPAVPWVTGRPAWVADYASHYRTSRHFIARSLNGKPDYNKQNVVEGDRFNIISNDKNIAFYLVVDVYRCKMWFYYVDGDTHEKVLVKSYSVGLGRWDPSTESGSLTPLGSYTLGARTAVFTPKSKGPYKGQDVTMMEVFGTRWIPFEKEIAGCTAPAKGLGLHGCPWKAHPATLELSEDTSGIGHHASDGCIRLTTSDVEELYAVIVSRPTTVILVSDFFDAVIPGT